MFVLTIWQELLLGVIAAVLFLYRNPDKNLRKIISPFVLGIFVSQAAYIHFDSLLPGQIAWGVSAAGLLTLYFLRFRAKPNKTAIDFLKTIAVIVLVIYPIPFYTLISVRSSFFWDVINIINSMIFYILGSIYVYDRFILKPHGMKRKCLTILVAQTLLIGLFWVYAFVQQVAATKNAEYANEQRIQSDHLRIKNEELNERLKNCR